MKQNKKQGFTLIELLVVVLIIGILLAIALPQYQAAVDKSRYATMIQTARSIANAQEIFYIANGHYADSFDELDVSLSDELPLSHDGRLSVGSAGFSTGATYTSAIYYSKGDERIASFTVYYRHSALSYKGSIRCFVYASNKERGDRICKSFGGQLMQDDSASCGDSGSTICKNYKLADF